MATKLKIHRFTDCKGFKWRSSEEDREVQSRITKLLEYVTCGACKQRILNVILEADWDKLDRHTLLALDSAVAIVHLKRHDSESK